MLAPIAITPGEPAGIGPDIVLQLALQPLTHPILVFADKSLLLERANKLGITINIKDYHESESLQANSLYIKHIALSAKVQMGEVSEENANYVLNTIEQAAHACMAGKCAALVTGPVHKAIINKAGFDFVGHTQYLAELAGVNKTVMLFVSDAMKVALLTTHLPLKEVYQHISADNITECIAIIKHDLAHYFNLKNARILVCGLNPHAGEQGHLGIEELRVIAPTLSHLRTQAYQVIGPVSADSAFTQHSLAECDVVLAMYHDQALPVIKYASFGKAVNVTLGLPFIRTSVDHGTALTLAGSGQADPQSLFCAYQCAVNMINTTRTHALST